MVQGSRYNLPFRRRREMRTDYARRRALIASGTPRLVIRCTGKHTMAQVVEAKSDGDRTLLAANSIELQKFGWKGGCGNISAAYLTGLLIGFRAKRADVEEVVPDIGVRRAAKGGRISAALKGAGDAGLKVPHGEEFFPNKARVEGEHIASYAKQIQARAEVYRRYFSQYLAKGLKPEDFTSHFGDVKATITKSFSEEVKGD